MKLNSSKITVILLGIAVVLLLVNYFQIQNLKGSISGVTGFTVLEGKNVGIVEGAVPVEFYVMSQCPYGIQVENAIAPVLKELEGYADFRVDFIANGRAGNFNSLHGQSEVDGDIIQLCVQENYPTEFMDFVVCQNENPRDLTATIDSCSRRAGIDADTIRQCWQGEEGIKFMEDSISKANSAGATGSPTMFVNNKPYRGDRSSQGLLTTICNELAEKPDGCSAAIESQVADVQGGCG